MEILDNISHRFHIIENSACSNCDIFAEDTIEHTLFYCTKRHNFRLKYKIDTSFVNISNKVEKENFSALVKEVLPITDVSAQNSFERRNKSCSALDLRPRPTKLEPLVSLQERKEHLPRIKPGSLDEKIKSIIESVEDKQKPGLREYCKEIKALPKTSKEKNVDNFSILSSKDEENYRFFNALDEHVNKHEIVDDELEGQNEQKIDLVLDKILRENETSRVTTDYPKMPENSGDCAKTVQKMRIAKRFHDENLRHKPLPDVIDDPVYKALNSSRHPNPGGALNVEPMPSAIGWKYYKAPGPTECSKLKVFRPKTSVDKAKSPKELRPKTGGSTYRKHFLPIDLAICWDLIPEDPSDEPKRTPHIDGSNGSVAPAVFTMIRSTERVENEQSILGSSRAVADKITKGIDECNSANLPSQVNGKMVSPIAMPTNKEAIMTCVKAPKQKADTPDSLNSISTSAAEYARKNPKTAWTQEDTSKTLSDRLLNLQKENGTKKYSESPKQKLHQSTPDIAAACNGSHCGTEESTSSSKNSNLSKVRSVSSTSISVNGHKMNGFIDRKISESKARKNEQRKNKNCTACEKINGEIEEPREKSEFKQAFKAGVPKSENSNSGSSSAAKSYKVPKMRLPYAKKNYSIGTLAPPFSIWRENTGQEYPEHWRLASVYQHSYKPINIRKRPLLASVYQ